MQHKTDPALGRRVQDALEAAGVQTPTNPDALAVSDQTKMAVIEARMKDILDVLGLDTTDDSLTDTPARVAKMFVKELYWGLQPEAFP